MNRQLAMKGLLAAAVVLPGLALGAVHPPVLAGCLIIAAGLFLYLAVDRRGRSTVRVDLASALLMGLAVFTAIQMVPLPSGLVELISPQAFEIRSGAMRPLGEPIPALMPLTLDVPLTAMELAKLLFYCAVYFAAAAWTRRHGTDLILGLVVAAGVAAAFVFLAHKILMLQEIYGFYDPIHARHSGERVSAPLLNENHMAALLGLSAAVAVGMAVSARERSRRILMVLIAGLLGGSLLLTLSRGGIAAFVMGQLLFIAMRVINRAMGKRDEESRSQLAWLPLGLAVSLALGFFVAQDAILGEFIGGDHRKIEMLSEGLPLIKDFPATGVGRGAFWVGFSMVSDWDSIVTFTHAENAVVQVLADWGVVAGGIALLGFGFIGARRLVRPPARTKIAAAIAALAAFGAHNLVDFNMEVPGVAVLAVALLGAICGSEPRNTPSVGTRSGGDGASGRVLSRASLVALAIAAVVMSVVTGIYVSKYHVDQEERSLRSALAAGDTSAFGAENIAPALLRHPASWYIPFIKGVHEFAGGPGRSLPWFSRALEINPDSASAHLYVGRELLRTGHLNQAMLEFRLASRRSPRLAPDIARFLVGAHPDFARISRVAVDEEDRVLLWGAIATEFARRDLGVHAEAADLALLELKTDVPRSMARHSRRLAGRGEYEGAIELARGLSKIEGSGATASALEAEILTGSGRSEEAHGVLARALEAMPDDRMLLRSYARACQELGDIEGALDTIGRMKRLSTDSKTLAAISIFEGDLQLKEGRVRSALASYRQAHALDPRNAGLLARIADLSEKQGDVTRALDALRKLHEIDPANEEWSRKLRDLEMKLRERSRGLVNER